ncbi:hypothetical protein OESDEN_02036 [Oesophagostomum dentatum]|uniref:7TM chemoreceptor n=1 Tax=Oesophagostomum dentatum TaxID=61180 RepID=A0A0B1TRF7_OESDE|nr:hypothetical protein OESDEN_02036 [Oesophagostomum dentatum]
MRPSWNIRRSEKTNKDCPEQTLYYRDYKYYGNTRFVPDSQYIFYLSHGICRLLGPRACYTGCGLVIALSAMYPVDIIREKLSEAYSYDISNECVTGYSTYSWRSLYISVHMSIPVYPAYVAILILRRGIKVQLSKNRAMTERSRRMHSQLLKAISYQACLPMLFILCVLGFTLGRYKILRHPVIEYFFYVINGLIPVITPLLSLYYIGPYRNWIVKKFAYKNPSSAKANTVQVNTLNGNHLHTGSVRP